MANPFTLQTPENRDYAMQEPEAFTMAQAANVFIAPCPKQKLTFCNAPLPLRKVGTSLAPR